MADDAITKEIRIEARPETVFSLLTDEDRVTSWMGTQAQLDPRPGGIYRVHVIGGSVERGEFVEVVPNERVVYTFGWEGGAVAPGSTRVELTLTEDGDGTLLRMVHSGLDTAEQRDMHMSGWTHYFERLKEVAEGRDPGPDPWLAEAEQAKT